MGAPFLLRALRAISRKHIVEVLEILEQERNAEVAKIFEMSHGIQTIGTARIARNENKIARAGAFRRPLKIVVRMNRLIVLVDSEQRQIKVVTGILEVVRVAAKECRFKFGREYEPHVRVFFVSVKIV